MTGPKEKKERTLGVRLQVKGDRCAGPKCALARRPNRPGVHGGKRQRKTLSDFGKQLREKQKFKISYGVDEKNLGMIFKKASRKTGGVASRLMEIFERRIDNVVFRVGMAPSRSAARQYIVHGHIIVNGKKLRSPGYQVKTGDVVGVREESRSKTQFKELQNRLGKQDMPDWLAIDSEKGEGRVLAIPEEFESPFEINLLVESFSK